MVPNMKHPSNYKGIVLNDSIHITGNAAIGSLTEEYFNGDTHFTDHFHLLKDLLTLDLRSKLLIHPVNKYKMRLLWKTYL